MASSSPLDPPLGTPEASPSEKIAMALGRVPSGLFVVTWRTEGADRVMLASWVMQAGFDPPLASIAIAPSRELLAAARAGSPFVINVLAENQRGLLARFGKPIPDGEKPFEGISVDRTPDGLARLSHAAAWLCCRMVGEAVAVGADHVVILGRIEAGGGKPDTEPLVHVRRNGLKY